MDYRQYAKYFKPMNKIPLIIGIVAAVIGAVLAVISIDTMAIGFVMLVVGVIVAISVVTSRTKGDELDDYAERIKKKTLDTMLKRTEMDPKYLKMYPPIYAGGYEYSGDLQMKEDLDGSIRTAKYKVAGMLFTELKMYIYEHNISFDSPDQVEELHEIKYSALKDVEVETLTRDALPGMSKKVITYYHLNINFEDGSKIVIPVSNDATTDETVRVLNRRIETKKVPKTAL